MTNTTSTASVARTGATAPERENASVAEAQRKAAFLYNFARFVEWPAGILVEPTSPIVICVLGQDPVTQELDRSIPGKFVDRHPVVIRDLKPPADEGVCQILFVAAGSERAAKGLLGRDPNAPVLTVGNRAGFAREHGIMNFTVQEDRVRFDINIDATKRARLKMSAKILSLANIVHDAEGRGGEARKP